MIETEKKTERVFLVGVELADTENFDLSMEELQSLAKTAGAEVVGSYSQKREKYDSKNTNNSSTKNKSKAGLEDRETKGIARHKIVI